MKSVLFLGALLLSGCATYNYAENVKMVSFDENVQKGKSIGQIRGEDCTWTILGNQLGGAPTIDKAFMNTRTGADSIESAGFSMKSGPKEGQVRYVNNVTTKTEGFNAYLFGKNCLVVTGIGYK